MRGRYILMLAALLSCVSCLKDDNSYKTPQAAITSFTIGYYNVRFHDMNIHGHDTLVYVREGGVMYPMTIDQVNNRIFNADSMAYGSELTKVTCSVYGFGTVGYRYVDEPETTYAWSAYDSIDFTRKLQFVILSTDESFRRTYDVEVNVRKVFPDSLVWTNGDTVGFPSLSGIIAAVRNDSIFCFGTDTSGVPSVSWYSVTGGAWNGANPLSGINADGWSHRVTTCNSKFFTACSGSLYASSDGINWSSVKSGIKSVMVSSEDYGELFAVSQDSNILRSSDMSEWTTVQSLPEGFPDSAAVVFSYPLSTNASLKRSVLVGLNSDTVFASVWTILSGDTLWTQVDAPANLDLRPKVNGSLSLIRYDGSLFSLGQGLDGFRQSVDNGITWYWCDSYVEDYSSWNRYMQLPQELIGYESGFAAATDSKGYIWIMTDNGQVWRGSINRLRK